MYSPVAFTDHTDFPKKTEHQEAGPSLATCVILKSCHKTEGIWLKIVRQTELVRKSLYSLYLVLKYRLFQDNKHISIAIDYPLHRKVS